ncbi:MAG: PAS domain-containing protein [Deltaproteobacteria bacterium]|nr:PAS domain-containing protein [Deltaproteobacteria bacterium]
MTESSFHRELLAISSDLLGVLRSDGVLTFSNEFWMNRLCASGDQCAGLNANDFVHIEDLEEFNRNSKLVSELSGPMIFEGRVKSRSGHAIWMRWRFEKSESSPVVLICGKDITDEKTSSTQLRQIEQVSNIGSWEIDMETMELCWSAETYAIHELDPRTYKPKLEDGISFYPDEAAAVVRTHVEKLMATGEGFDVRLRFRTAKGNLRWVRSASRAEMRDGNVVRVYGSIQDVTDEVGRESASRAIGERYEAIVNNIPLMVSLFNPNGEFEWVNPDWIKEVGWDLESMKGRDMMKEFCPDPEYRKEVLDFMLSGSPGWNDVLIRKRDGTSIYTSWANVRLSNGYSIGIGRNIDESMRLHSELRDAYERLKMAMSVGGLGTWELYPKTGQVKFCDEWCDMLGLDPATVVHDISTWKSIVHPEDAEVGYRETYRCLNGETPVYNGVQRLRHANGSWVWVQTSGRVTKRNENGEPEKFLAITINITHLKQSEALVVEQNRVLELMKRRLELAVRAGRFGVWDWNYKTGELVWDQLMYEIFDIDPMEFTNDYDAFQKVMHPEDAPKVRDQLDSAFRSRAQEFRSEFRIISRDGNIKMIAALASCFYDEEGKIDRLVGNNWDVTEQRNAESALAEARVEAERFFTMSLDLLAVAGFDGFLKRVNPSFLSVLGYTEKELLARPVLDFVHPEDREATVRETLSLESGRPAIRFENRFRTIDGRYRTFSWVSTPDVETKTIFCAVRDLTDQRENELKLLQSARMATLGEMAGGIAHEVNNPLAIIHGRASQILRVMDRGQLDLTKLRSDLVKIEATADRIAKIIRGLRTFSRDSSSDPMTLAKVNGMIAEVLDLAGERFKNHEVQLLVFAAEDLLISCRPQQIGQVLLNLINNAHDAVIALAERWVRIDVTRAGKMVRITVTDSGKGIPAEIAAKIMNPFFTTKEVGQGTGLGLSISKGIAEDHGGTLKYDFSSENTRFVFEVPVANEIEIAQQGVS